MDANGLRFWMLADAAHWPRREHTLWDKSCQALALASERSLPAAADDAAARAAAMLALDQVPRALDAVGVVASWQAEANAIAVRGYLPNAAVALPLAETPTDLAIGADGVLFVALADGVLMHDLRRRWADARVTAPGFAPWRLACDKRGGAWVLERDSGRLARLSGYPLPAQTPQRDDYAPQVFRPDPENCHIPRLRVLPDLGWLAGERVLALAHHAGGGLAFLSWSGAGGTWLRRWDEAQGRLSDPIELTGAQRAYALAWLDGQRIAVRMPGRPDAPSFSLDPELGYAPRLPLGEVYPLADDARAAAFVHRVEGPAPYPAHYPARADGAEPLLPLSLTNLARAGMAANYQVLGDSLRAQLLDSGSPATVWHRLRVEASIPPHCAFALWLATSNDPMPPAEDDLEAWHPHLFGRDLAALGETARLPQVPRAAWEPAPSELPGHPGLASWTPERDVRGLFTALIQNARARVRRLAGRYLWIRAELVGDGRFGPEIAAVRAWGSRFSYAEQYLPRVYRETLFGDPAQQPGELIDRIDEAYGTGLDAGGTPAPDLAPRLVEAGIQLTVGAQVVVETAGSSWLLLDGASGRNWRLRREPHAIGIYRPLASPADFLARMLGNFEGVLTRLEDRIASAHLFTDPAAVPAEHLDWLAAWVGLAFDPALPESRRRAWLAAAPQLARWHGTRRGLALALDLATGGGVQGGEIVIIEDFRLQRILATLLGVDLADENDPLLPGLRQSGNSVVGDTLVLGALADAERAELMALYRDEASTEAEDEAIRDFYGHLAHRATVLVHREVEAQDFGLIRRIVELEAPAHVDTRVVAATWPFLVGIASLVGVDTYLARPRLPQPVRVHKSAVGVKDFLLGPVSVDPRLSGAAAPPIDPPVAEAGVDREVAWGRSFILDGSDSQAAQGRNITEYRWRLLPPEA